MTRQPQPSSRRKPGPIVERALASCVIAARAAIIHTRRTKEEWVLTFAGMTVAILGLVAGPAAPAAAPAPAPTLKPVRIMTMNECADILLLQMVPKARIASVTYRAHDAIQWIEPGLDAGVPINHGSAEEIVAEKPDLIIAGDFSTAVTKRVARAAGAPLIEIRSATSFEDIRQITRQVGAAVGEPQRADALIAEMDATLASLAASRPPRPFVVAAWSGDSVPGRKTLANAIIEAAGAVNIASKLDTETYNSFGAEELLAARPDVLMYGATSASKPSLTDAQNGLLMRIYAGRRITYPETLYNCGVPQSAKAALDLRRALVAVEGRGRR